MSILRSIRNDRNGGIEGLPLQLMIIILVATMGTAILLGWMGSIETPKSIGDVTALNEPVIADSSNTIKGVEILVTDQDGNPLEGATVVLTGYGVTDLFNQTAFKTTGSDGVASFGDLKITPQNSKTCYITINVSKSGYGEDSSNKLAVIVS